MSRKIVITGGAGYIASVLISKLNEDDEIIVIDNFCIDTPYKREHIETLSKKNVTFIEADTSKVEKYEQYLKDTDIAIYMASLNSHTESNLKSAYYIDENSRALQTFFNALKEASPDLSKIILTSSRAVYGEGKYECGDCGIIDELFEGEKCVCGGALKPLPNTEKDFTMPRSVYGLTKRFQEEQILLYALKNDVNLDIFRIYNVYGHGQEKFYNHIGIIPMLHDQIVKNKKVTLYGDGEIYRDYVDVENVVEVLMQSINQADVKRKGIFNLGSGESISIKEICDLLKESLKIDFEVALNSSLDDIRHSKADNSKLKANFKVDFNSVRDFIKECYKN